MKEECRLSFQLAVLQGDRPHSCCRQSQLGVGLGDSSGDCRAENVCVSEAFSLTRRGFWQFSAGRRGQSRGGAADEGLVLSLFPQNAADLKADGGGSVYRSLRQLRELRLPLCVASEVTPGP